MGRNGKRLLVLLLTIALVLPFGAGGEVQAKKKISLNRKRVTLKVGKSTRLKVKGTKKKVTWKSNKKKVATVNKKGKVRARRVGNARITAKVAGKKLVCRVVVTTNCPPPPSRPTRTILPDVPQEVQPQVTQAPQQAQNTQPAAPQTTQPVQTQEAPTGKPQLTQEPEPVNTMPVYEAGTPEAPVVSRDSGIFEDGFILYLTAQPGTEIYYTTDGSIPTKEDIRYEGGIQIRNRNGEPNVLTSAANIKKMNIPNSGYDYAPTANQVAKCTVIRAVAIGPNGDTSDMVTKSYFVGNDVKNKYAGAHVASLVIDPDFLLNDETGIHVLGKIYDEWKTTDEGKQIIARREYHNYEANYTQHGKSWERAANFEYFDSAEESLEFATGIGVRLHGGASRMYGQKSFNLYMREEYGAKNLKYPLLPGDVDAEGRQIEKYKSFMLRNGGNDTELSKIRDIFTQNQVKDRNYAVQAATPCVLFLNGEYWGLYNLTEKYGDNNVENNFGVDKDNVVIYKEGELEEGKDEDAALYEELWSYAEKDFTDQAVYDSFCNIMDIDSFTDFYATEIYIANNDWNPEKNYQLWRTRDVVEGNPYGDGKWRYLLYDTEFAMGLYGSTNASTKSFSKALEQDSLFATIMKNQAYQEKFLAALKEIGSKNFNPDTCSARLDEYKAAYTPLLKDFYPRFYGENDWRRNKIEDEVKTMKTFLSGRYSSIVGEAEAWCKKN